jgi:ketosteroid isomerase-like protein
MPPSAHCDVGVFREAVLREFNASMNERDAFLTWFNTVWRDAEVALHNGDAAPRFQTWSDREPVTLFGAWLNATGPAEAREVFLRLADAFSEATSSEIELVAADVSGNLAYTVHREITSTIVNGEPRDYVLRVTQVYRRDDGDWKVVHRHGDNDPDADHGP